jgi:hypothetical protein
MPEPVQGVAHSNKIPANRPESRRPDSNRGPLHYEGKTSEGRAGTRGYARALSCRKAGCFRALAIVARARRCPRRRTRFVPGTPESPLWSGATAPLDSRRPRLPGPLVLSGLRPRPLNGVVRIPLRRSSCRALHRDADTNEWADVLEREASNGTRHLQAPGAQLDAQCRWLSGRTD